MENILVANVAGTVGKSTIASIQIAPRFGCDEVIAIETENPAGSRYAEKVKRFTAELYDDWLEYVLDAREDGKNTITDLGASNYVSFVNRLSLGGNISLIDYLVVVTDTQERSQEDAVATIQTFFNIGLDPAKLRIVLNKAVVPTPELSIERQYDTLFTSAEVDPRIKINPNCYMPALTVFDHIASNGIKWSDLLADNTDHAAALKATIGEGATLARAKRAAFRIAQMAKDPAIKFSDRLFKELNIGSPVRLIASAAKAEAPAALEVTKSDLGRQSDNGPSITEKTSTAKA